MSILKKNSLKNSREHTEQQSPFITYKHMTHKNNRIHIIDGLVNAGPSLPKAAVA